MKIILHLFKTALLNILRQPEKAKFVFATVFAGVMAFVLFDSFNQGIMIDYRTKLIRGMQGNGHIYTKGYFDKKPVPLHSGWIQSYESVQKKLELNPHVQGAFPRVRFSAFVTQGKQNLTGIGMGIDAKSEANFFDSLKMKSGKQLTTESNGIVLGEGLATALQKTVGDTVTVLSQTLDERLNGSDLQVVGIFSTGMSSLDDVFFFVPLKVAQLLLDTNLVEYFAIGLKNLDSWKHFLPEIAPQIANEFEAISFEEMDKVYYENSVNFLSNQFYLMGSVFTLVVCLGIANAISIQLFQRRREIGTYLINGQTRLQTMLGFIFEALIVCFLSYVVAIFCSFILIKYVLSNGIYMPPAPGFKNPYYAQLHFDWTRVALLGLIPIFISCITTLLVAKQTCNSGSLNLLNSST
jgi:putative ABC transport system permease protein